MSIEQTFGDRVLDRLARTLIWVAERSKRTIQNRKRDRYRGANLFDARSWHGGALAPYFGQLASSRGRLDWCRGMVNQAERSGARAVVLHTWELRCLVSDAEENTEPQTAPPMEETPEGGSDV